MIEQLEEYAKHLNANSEILSWLKVTGQKAIKNQKIDVSEMEHVLDFLVSPAAPQRLQKMSVVDAKRKASEWSAAQQKKGKHLNDSDDDIETIHDFKDGTRIVLLKTKESLQREGFLMGHCSGGYSIQKDQQLYSYRDAKNLPHATFEVKKSNNEIVQIKGKGNGPIHPKYIHPILAFLEVIGMKIRPPDMANLGYYHLPKQHLAFLKQFKNAAKQMTEIKGEVYAF